MAALFESGIFGNGTKAWHGLGDVVEGVLTATEARHLGSLEWEPELQPIFDSRGVAVKGHQLVVRNSDYAHLGIVSEHYALVDNTTFFNFADAVVRAQGGAHYDAAGSLRNGQIVFANIDLAHTFEVVKNDPISTYLAVANGFDGKTAFRLGKTTIRQVCWNTVQLAWADAQRHHTSWSFTHLGDVSREIEEARVAIGLALKEETHTQSALEIMACRSYTDDTLAAYLSDVFPLPQPPRENAKLTTQAQYHYLREQVATRKLKILELLDTGKGADIAGVRGTWYGALNGVTEWSNHAYRGSEARRLESLWFGERAEITAHAFSTALEYARHA